MLILIKRFFVSKGLPIALALAVAAASGAAAYVMYLRSENATLLANEAVRQGTIESLRTEIEARQQDTEEKAQLLRERMAQIADLTRVNANLNRDLLEATKDDEKVVECLAVRPGPDYVNRLREYTQSSGNEGAGEALSRSDLLRWFSS